MRAARLVIFGLWLSCCAQGQDHSPGPYQRIVVIGPNTAEIICALGACDQIVGVSKFCVFPPELKSRTQIGGLYDADLEGIMALKPDLLVTRGRHDSLEQLAGQLKITVYHDEADSLEGVERTVLELGDLLNRRPQAEAVVSQMHERIREIRRRTHGKPKVRVLLTVSRNPDRMANILTAGRGTFLTEMLEIAGGTNVFGDLDMRYPEVSVESIIVKQPDCIVELMPEVDVAAHEKRLRRHWADLPDIPAVRNNRMYFLSDDNALIPSPRYVQFIEKVAALLHPDGNLK